MGEHTKSGSDDGSTTECVATYPPARMLLTCRVSEHDARRELDAGGRT